MGSLFLGGSPGQIGTNNVYLTDWGTLVAAPLAAFTIEFWSYGLNCQASFSTRPDIMWMLHGGDYDSYLNLEWSASGITRNEMGALFKTNLSGYVWAFAGAVHNDAPTTWNHICVTWDGSNIRYYWNGVQEPTTTPMTGTIDFTTGIPYMMFGQYSTPPNAYFREYRMFNYAKTLPEIVVGMYRQTVPDRMHQYYKLDETAADTAPGGKDLVDLSGNAYHLADVGGTIIHGDTKMPPISLK